MQISVINSAFNLSVLTLALGISNVTTHQAKSSTDHMSKDADTDKSFISRKRFKEQITSVFLPEKKNHLFLGPQSSVIYFLSPMQLTQYVRKGLTLF